MADCCYLLVLFAIVLPYTVPALESLSAWNKESIKNWYPKLKKAPWSPPNWVFGAVWSVIYGLMGYASYLVWHEGQVATSPEVQEKVSCALIVYAIHLALNWAWTPLFFKYHMLGVALFEFVLVWISVVVMVVSFYAVSHLAAYLMVPLLVWGSYAITLNYYVWANNDSTFDTQTKTK